MSEAGLGWVTALLRLPMFYNPDAAGHRAPIEDGKFVEPRPSWPTGSAAARSSSFATIRHEGSGGTRASSTETCWP